MEGPRTLRVRQWRCGRCGKTCADAVRGVERGARCAKGVKREALRVLYGEKTNIPTAVRRMRERLGWSPSPSTVKRAMHRAHEGSHRPEAPSTGIFLVREPLPPLLAALPHLPEGPGLPEDHQRRRGHNPISHRNASVAGRGDWLDCTGLAD